MEATVTEANGRLMTLLEAADAIYGQTKGWEQKKPRIRRQKALRYFQTEETRQGRALLVRRGGKGRFYVSEHTLLRYVPFTRHIDPVNQVEKQRIEIMKLKERIEKQDRALKTLRIETRRRFDQLEKRLKTTQI
jgi:hypothetical protein